MAAPKQSAKMYPPITPLPPVTKLSSCYPRYLFQNDAEDLPAVPIPCANLRRSDDVRIYDPKDLAEAVRTCLLKLTCWSRPSGT